AVLRSCSVNSRRVPWLFSIQLREFAAQSFAILLMHLLGMQELGQKHPRPRSVVAALLKLGNECQLPLDYDLALGYVLLRQGKVIQHHLPIHCPAYHAANLKLYPRVIQEMGGLHGGSNAFEPKS